VNSKKITEKST